jgi:adenylate kinase
LFDGFQEHSQAKALDVASKKKSITATIALEADDEILVARLLDRGKTSGRADDQDEEKKKSLPKYNEKQPFNGVL